VTADVETDMAGKFSWDQANRRQKLGLVWRIRKKISQIIKDYFYLPFFLLIILWFKALLFGKDDNECRLFFRLDLMQMVVDSPAGDGICADQDYLGNELHWQFVPRGLAIPHFT
jgi:hypothetical protein